MAPVRRLEQAGSSDAGYFFPGEVTRLLDLGDIDYHQLRRIFVLGRRQAGLPVPTGWARYTLHDIARVSVAIRVSGGRAALIAGRRLQLKPVQDACEALQRRGYIDPLLRVPLEREGRTVFAVIKGAVVDPVTGQVLMKEVLSAATRFLTERAVHDRQLLAALREERGAVLRPGRLSVNDGLVEIETASIAKSRT